MTRVIESETPYARCVGFHLLNWKFGTKMTHYLSDTWVEVSYGPLTLIKVYER